MAFLSVWRGTSLTLPHSRLGHGHRLPSICLPKDHFRSVSI